MWTSLRIAVNVEIVCSDLASSCKERQEWLPLYWRNRGDNSARKKKQKKRLSVWRTVFSKRTQYHCSLSKDFEENFFFNTIWMLSCKFLRVRSIFRGYLCFLKVFVSNEHSRSGFCLFCTLWSWLPSLIHGGYIWRLTCREYVDCKLYNL